MAKKITDKIKDKNIQSLILFMVSLVIFNIAFISSNGWARLGWNLLGYFSLLIAYRSAQLSLQSVGLSRNSIKQGAKYGLISAGVILLIMLSIFFIDKTAYNDSRYQQNIVTALYAVLILLPLKTVLFEELAFRGILPALLLKINNRRRFVAVTSSVVFGLWHIFSAAKIGSYSLSGDFIISNFFVVAAVFIATSVAGYLLYELRVRSGSLLAPIIVHWSINGFGIILASLSWR